MTEKSESNRRRKWAPKARTGCRTCKTRHVKCDEAKPVCRRCVLSGFRCDGYPPTPNKRENDAGSPDEGSPNGGSPESTESIAPEAQRSSSVVTTRTETPASSVDSFSVITPMVVSPSEPYVNAERYFFKYFIELTSAMVGRSKSGPYFWQTLVPQAAWSFPSVRHALLATAMSCESLLNREKSIIPQQRSNLLMLSHGSKALQALIAKSVPLDVVLLTSATLGILELFNGQWDTACTHVSSGATLAKQAQIDHNSNPYISFYCEAFASALPTILTRVKNGSNHCPPEKNTIVRLNEAVRSLRLGRAKFDEALPRIAQHRGADRDRIAIVVSNAKRETEWILQQWENLLRKEKDTTSPPDDDLQINLHRVESPWSALMAQLDVYLQEGGHWNIDKFEVAMERTLPFYMLAKSGPNIKMRETAVQLMYIGTKLRGKMVTAPQNPPRNQRASEATQEGD